jgi:hypothetical protein
MKEVTFLDRVPTYPGRVVLTPVSGQANTFDMVRADAPRVEGTPLDKATFESVIHSRLTGRFYSPMVGRSVVSTQTITANPIPTSGWVNESNAKYRSGAYVIEASTAEAGYGVERAFDGNSNTEWHSATSNTRHHVQVNFEQPIKANKMRLKASYAPNNQPLTITIQGSNDGAAWTDLHTITYEPTTLSEITLSKSGYFSSYRLVFSSSGAIYAYASEWQLSEYEIESFSNNYTIADGTPNKWTEGQRIMVAIPTNAATAGVVSNSLNGITITTILQPSRRYELVYTGTQFIATEV